MVKKIFLHALMASVIATAAALVYSRIYYFATDADFSKVINTRSVAGFNIFVCLIAAFINWGLLIWLQKKGDIFFNFIFSIASFSCIVIPISATLPLDIKFPELFPGLTVPMVLFPALAWYTIKPLFNENRQGAGEMVSSAFY